MEDRLNYLLEKYWNAESSLEEEKELKELIRHSENWTEQKILFEGLQELKEIEADPIQEMPIVTSKKPSFLWLKVAALFLIFLISISVSYRYFEKRAEEKAYEEVLAAFELIQENFQKAKENLEPFEDLRYLQSSFILLDPTHTDD